MGILLFWVQNWVTLMDSERSLGALDRPTYTHKLPWDVAASETASPFTAWSTLSWSCKFWSVFQTGDCKMKKKNPLSFLKTLSQNNYTQKRLVKIIPSVVWRGFILKVKAGGLPWWPSGKEPACQCRRRRFNPCSGKIPHAAKQLSPWATTTEPLL